MCSFTHFYLHTCVHVVHGTHSFACLHSQYCALAHACLMISAFHISDAFLSLNMTSGSPYSIDTDDGSDRVNCTSNVVVAQPLFKTDFSGHSKTFQINVDLFSGCGGSQVCTLPPLPRTSIQATSTNTTTYISDPTLSIRGPLSITTTSTTTKISDATLSIQGPVPLPLLPPPPALANNYHIDYCCWHHVILITSIIITTEASSIDHMTIRSY